MTRYLVHGTILHMPPEVTLYTTTEIASRYGVDGSTVRRWVSDGVLKPAVKTPGGHYRFDATEVDKILAAKPAA